MKSEKCCSYLSISIFTVSYKISIITIFEHKLFKEKIDLGKMPPNFMLYEKKSPSFFFDIKEKYFLSSCVFYCNIWCIQTEKLWDIVFVSQIQLPRYIDLYLLTTFVIFVRVFPFVFSVFHHW